MRYYHSLRSNSLDEKFYNHTIGINKLMDMQASHCNLQSNTLSRWKGRSKENLLRRRRKISLLFDKKIHNQIMTNLLLRRSKNRIRSLNYHKISSKIYNLTKTIFAQLLQERLTLRYLSLNQVIKLLALLRLSNRKMSLKIQAHHLLISNMIPFNNEMQNNDRKVVI